MGVDKPNTDPGQGLTEDSNDEKDVEFWIWFLEGAALQTKMPLDLLKKKLQSDYKMLLPHQTMEAAGSICITIFFRRLVEVGIIKEEVANKVAERVKKKSGKTVKAKVQD